MTPPESLRGGPVYLDCNATTPVDPAVAARPFLTTRFGNPSSGHRFGHEPTAALERARGRVAGLVGAGPGEIVFTGSEANRSAIRGAAPAFGCARPHLTVQATEHPAVLEAARSLRRLHRVRVTVSCP